jgi:hypothetical protein
MRKFLIAVIIIVLFNFIGGCDKGIEPLPSAPSGPTGFSGKVTFTGTWPTDIKRTHLVVFKDPLLSSADFFPPNLSFVIDSIPNGTKEFNYNSIDNNFISTFTLAAGTYKYIIVAQSKTPLLSLNRSDWFVVGIYTTNGNQSDPGLMTIQQGYITTGIDINVDFNNPPLQPPGG